MDDWLAGIGRPGWGLIAPLAVGVLLGLWIYLRGRETLDRPKSPRTPPPDPPPSPPAADPLHDPFLFGGIGEKRAAPRRRGNAVPVLIAGAGGEGPERRAWVVDRSVSGLAIETDEPVAEGALWTVRAAEKPACPWVDVVVRSCRASNGTWVVGCQFRRTPSSTVLLFFG